MHTRFLLHVRFAARLEIRRFFFLNNYLVIIDSSQSFAVVFHCYESDPLFCHVAGIIWKKFTLLVFN